MSVRAMSWAFDQPLAPTSKIVLLSLADHADDTGRCWPSISRLAQRATVSKSTVIRCLAALERAGFIGAEKRTRENGGLTSNLYRLRFNRVAQDVSPCVTDDQDDPASVNLILPPEEVGFDTPPSVTADTPPSVTADTSNRTAIKNHQKEPSLSADAEWEVDFEEFWAAYPKRPNNPKQPARRKYFHARRYLHASRETLVNAVKQYAATRIGEDPKFTAMAATWLHQRRWGDLSDTEVERAEHVATGITQTVREISGQYPGIIDRGITAEVAALMRSGVSGTELVVAAEKYKLWVKYNQMEGINLSVPVLSFWLKFRWRDMSNYDFCSRGLTNKKSVKLRKGTP